MPIEEQLKLPCAVRGFHEFKVDTVPPGYPKYAPVNMECKKCGMALLHRRQQSTKPVSTRTVARRPVPASSPKPAAAKSALPHDLWLDAACFLGVGSVASFEALVSGADLEPWQVAAMVRDLSWLGHLDVCIGDNHRPRSWSVSPPVLAYTAPGEAILAGFRCSSLLDDVEELLKPAGGKFSREQVNGQPMLVRVEGLPIEAARELLDVVSDPHARVLKIIDNTPVKLAAFAQASGGLFSHFKPISLGFDGETQRYDAVRGRWRSTSNTTEPGAYRIAHAGTTYAFRGQDSRSLSGPHELVKLAAARAEGIHLHAYSEGNRVFSSRLGCEPPGLLGRALVACSGRLPEISNGESRFHDVPPAVAGAVLAYLYTGDLPS